MTALAVFAAALAGCQSTPRPGATSPSFSNGGSANSPPFWARTRDQMSQPTNFGAELTKKSTPPAPAPAQAAAAAAASKPAWKPPWRRDAPEDAGAKTAAYLMKSFTAQ